MARYTFGGKSLDVVVRPFSYGARRLADLVDSTAVTFYSAASGGTQYTDLLLNGSPVTSVTTDSDGYIPEFSGPDGIGEMWAQVAGASTRRLITATIDVTEYDLFQESVLTLNEARDTVSLSDGDITATTERVIYVASGSVEIEQLSLAFGQSVATSDTNYWRVVVNVYRSGVVIPMAGKTTRTSSPGTGEAITAYRAWTFDLSWNATPRLAAGDVVTIKMTPTGTPTALTAPTASFRINSTDTALTTVIDTFTRADSTSSLGSTDTSHTWTQLSGTWGISSNQAYASALAAGQTIAVIDTGVSDCTIGIKLSSSISSAGHAFRMTDANNGFVTNQTNLYRMQAGALTSLSTFSQTSVTGDTMRVVFSGSNIYVYRDAGTTGTFDLVGSASSTFNQTATMHGIRSGHISNRLDDFRAFV